MRLLVAVQVQLSVLALEPVPERAVPIGGRDNIELNQGTTFTILTSAPANVGYNPRN